MSPRCGAALALTLVLLVVLECVVLGTLHLALQEHRIGSNRTAALRLRLDAESAVRRALGHWSAALDSMATGPDHRVDIPAARSGRSTATIERLGTDLYLVRGTAHEPPPRVGRAAARLLVRPPLIPTGLDPAPAPLAAAGPVHIDATGVITAAPAETCAAGRAPAAVLTERLEDLTLDPGARLDAPPGPLEHPSLLDRLGPLIALDRAPGVIQVAGDTILDGPMNGILIVDGNVTLSSGAAVSGLILSTGAVSLRDGSRIDGAVLTRSGGTIGGALRWNPCAVRDAVSLAGLARPRAAGTRAWLPAF